MRLSKPRIVGVIISTASILAGAFFVNRYVERSYQRREALELAKKGSAQEALPALRTCLEREADDVELLQAIVVVMIRAGSPPEQIEPYSIRWCERQRDSVEALRARLEVLQKLNRSASEQIDVLERILGIDPSDYQTRMALASSYFTLGRYEDSIRESTVLLSSSPIPREEIQLVIARAHSSSGNLTAAAADLDRVLSASPSRSDARMLRGTVYQQMGDDVRAIACFLECKPRDLSERISLLHHLGLSYAHSNRSEDARRTFEQLTRIQEASSCLGDADQHPDDSSFQIRAANALLEAGLPGEAIAHLDRSLGRIRPSQSIVLKLAECHDRAGNTDRARELRSAAVRLP